MEHLLVAKINIQHFVTFVFFNSRNFSRIYRHYKAMKNIVNDTY